VSLFISDRERRLWTWTLVVVVAIYSTLGLARMLAGELRDRELLDASFLLGMLLIGAAIVTLALKTKTGDVEIGIALGVAAVYLLVFLRMAIPEERSHLIEYGVVAVFIHEALRERASHGRRVPVPALLAVGATALVGLLDKVIQGLLPSRVFEPYRHRVQRWGRSDGGRAIVALGWARRRKRSGSP
jgi:ribose/xylose/arabinose/galactoside ABC-type transport system permease subunit